MKRFLQLCTFGIVLLMMTTMSEQKSLTVNPEVTRKAADEILSNMDLSADPCKDFYQYACGRWIQKYPLPKTKSSWDAFDILNDNLTNNIIGILGEKSVQSDPKPLISSRAMYAACMDTHTIEKIGLKPLTDYLETLGGWPMTLTNWNESLFNWRAAAASVTRTYGLSYFIDITVDIDSRNTERNIIYVDQGSLALPKSVLMEHESSPNVIKAYKTYAIGSAKAVRNSLKTNATDAQIEAEIEAMLKFESDLAGIVVPDEERRNYTRMYNPMLVMELQNLTDSVAKNTSQGYIHWSSYLDCIFSLTSIRILNTEQVIVIEPDYLQDLVALLDKTSPRVLANYLLWRLVNYLSSDTTQQMIDLQFAFSKAQYGTAELENRSAICANKVNDLMGYAIGAKYVEKYFNHDAMSEISEMITNLKLAFKSLLEDATWMDSATKSVARDKIEAMVEFVGYPAWIKNTTALENYYDGPTQFGLQVSVSNSTHFQNIRNVNAFQVVQDLSTLRDKPDRTEWETSPTVVNAFYSEVNSITFPAGILQPPFFTPGRSVAMNYGAIGSVIGHEITHGFDDQGRQSDKYGNIANWWTEQTSEKYLGRANCFIEQYSNFTLPSGTHLNGVTTQGENIADNGGLRATLRAYRTYVTSYGAEPSVTGLEKFTAEQIMFLSFANNWCGVETPEEAEDQVLTDPHSNYRFRVNGPLSNNEDFAREFKCAAGTPMNRSNKCVLW